MAIIIMALFDLLNLISVSTCVASSVSPGLVAKDRCSVLLLRGAALHVL